MRRSKTWLWGPLRENLPSLKAAIFATILSFVLQIFVSLFPMVIYNKIIPNSAIESMITIVLGILLVIIFDFFFKLIKTRLVDAATSRMEVSLQKSLYNKIISWDLQNIPKLTGSSAALTRDLDNVAELFTSSSITVFSWYPICLCEPNSHLCYWRRTCFCSNGHLLLNIFIKFILLFFDQCAR